MREVMWVYDVDVYTETSIFSRFIKCVNTFWGHYSRFNDIIVLTKLNVGI